MNIRLTAGHNECFYCGLTFGPNELTREHVFPKWLQRRFTLWDQSLTLLNDTLIQYRNLVVPACHLCNTVVLSKLEGDVASSLPGGAEKIRALGHDRVFAWISKIFFGILYAEALLPSDRSNLGQGPILPDGALTDFEHMHFLMQSAHGRYEFHGVEVAYHTSILVFDVQEFDNEMFNFMYHDDVSLGCIAIRIGKIGIIYVADGGAQERIAQEVLPKLFAHQLHPLQFEEMTALTFARARGFNRNPLHILVKGGSDQSTRMIFQPPLAGLSNRPVFDEFDRTVFAQLLSQFTGIPLEIISPANGQVMTWIGDYGEPRFIDARVHHP